MEHKFTHNGETTIRLCSRDPIERAVFAVFAAYAASGKPVTVREIKSDNPHADFVEIEFIAPKPAPRVEGRT